MVTCNCGKSFASRESLLQHKQYADIHRRVICTCGKEFAAIEHMQEHVKNARIHQGNEPPLIKCSCGGTYQTKDAHRAHLKSSKKHTTISDRSRLTCCGRKFATVKGWDSHQRTAEVHQGVVCCSERFSTLAELSRHICTAQMHKKTTTDEKILVCSCGWEFATEAQLRRHLVWNGIHEDVCVCSCQRVFAKPIHMKMHRQCTHTFHDKLKDDLKPGRFVCDELEDGSETSRSCEYTDSDSNSTISLILPGYWLASGPGMTYDWSLCSDDCFWCGYVGLHDENAELSEELAAAISRLRT